MSRISPLLRSRARRLRFSFLLSPFSCFALFPLAVFSQPEIWDGVPYGESPWIYGVHDDGGESHMEQMGVPGWIAISEGIGRNPDDRGGRDYSPWADRGFGLLVRLNHGYGNDGTIPYEKQYDDFARRCAAFVAASKGCHLWIIGNETNLRVEWPKYEAREEPITPEMYARCFRKCRDAIRKQPGHGNDGVLVQAIAPWYAGEGRTYRQYAQEVFRALDGAWDGAALHAYTHGDDPNSPFSPEKRNGDMSWHLRVYTDFIESVPAAFRTKTPFYITESATCDPHVWTDANRGWVRNAHIEINRWNLDPRNPKIRSLCLYRWQPFDQHNFGSKAEVVQDWREAMRLRFFWTKGRPRRLESATPAAAPAAAPPQAPVATSRVSSGAQVPDRAWVDAEERFLEQAQTLLNQGLRAEPRDILEWLAASAESAEVRREAKARLAKLEP